MKPGSLVVCVYQPRSTGIIIRESKDYLAMVDNKAYRWWDVWIDNKIIVESEVYLALVE